MKRTSDTTLDPRAGGSRATTVGTVTMVAGALFVVAPLLGIVTEWAWPLLLVGFALLAYVVPQVHRWQAPADGWVGRAGSMLVVAGAALLVLMGLASIVWEAVDDTRLEQPGWADLLWTLGFFGFLAGILLFCAGSIMAGRLPRGAPVLMLVGLAGALLIDMATGAFSQDDGSTTEWGFFIGIPVFGLGLAWIGSALRGPGLRAGGRAERSVAG